MLDIENLIYDRVATALETAFPGINVSSTFLEEAEQFPTVCFYEISNVPNRRLRTIESIEDYTDVTYEANIYSAKQFGGKAEAREIAKVIDSVMAPMKFTRFYFSTVPNLDRTIYRIVVRWDATVGSKTIDGDTTKRQMYVKQ